MKFDKKNHLQLRHIPVLLCSVQTTLDALSHASFRKSLDSRHSQNVSLFKDLLEIKRSYRIELQIFIEPIKVRFLFLNFKFL